MSHGDSRFRVEPGSCRFAAVWSSSGRGDGGFSSTKQLCAPTSETRFDAPSEKMAARKFFRAVNQDVEAYLAMSEEDVKEEYRRAGKLHKYEPETELEKRFARLIRVHRPPHDIVPDIERYLSLIDDEED